MRPITNAVVHCVVFVGSATLADDWTGFRGGAAGGVIEKESLPEEWSQEQNIAWKVSVPGVAWSSPVVWGDRLYVTTAVTENQPKPNAQRGGGGFGRGGRRGPGGEQGAARPEGESRENPGEGAEKQVDESRRERPDGPRRGPGGFGGFGRGAEPPDAVYKWEVHCLDRATGKTIWSQVAAEHKPSIATHRTNTFASETPVIDGERIYAYFGMTGLFCYDLDGKILWQTELGSYPMTHGWGTGSSPVLVGDLLIIQCDNEEKSFLVAFDKKSGEEKWRVDRDERSTWSTPYVWENAQRTELVTGGSRKVRSYDPATGEVLWELPITGRSASTAVGDKEMVYIGTGGGMGVGPLVAIRAGASGELSMDNASPEGPGVVWTNKTGGPPMASPLLYDGNLYVLDQRQGILTCYNAKSGEQVYKKRIDGATGFTSSPWAANGKIYCLDGEGKTFVLQAGPEYNLLARNDLEEMTWSSPALADGILYLRTLEHLYCIKP